MQQISGNNTQYIKSNFLDTKNVPYIMTQYILPLTWLKVWRFCPRAGKSE